MFQAVDWLAILARGLYVETVSTITSARTVLAEQKPQIRIIERCLACAIISAHGCYAVIESNAKITDTLKIDEGKRFQNYLFHCTPNLMLLLSIYFSLIVRASFSTDCTFSTKRMLISGMLL